MLCVYRVQSTADQMALVWMVPVSAGQGFTVDT